MWEFRHIAQYKYGVFIELIAATTGRFIYQTYLVVIRSGLPLFSLNSCFYFGLITFVKHVRARLRRFSMDVIL